MKKVLIIGSLLLAGTSFPASTRAQGVPPARNGAVAEKADLPQANASPSSAEDYYRIGVNHVEAREYKEAVTAFKRSIHLKGDESKVYYDLGMTYFRLNQYKESADAYKQAVRFKQDWADARFRLGWMYYVLDRKQAAQEQYKALEKLDSGLYQTLGRILREPRSSEDTKPLIGAPATQSEGSTKKAVEPVSSDAAKSGETKAAESPAAANGTTVPIPSNTPAPSASPAPATTESSVKASSVVSPSETARSTENGAVAHENAPVEKGSEKQPAAAPASTSTTSDSASGSATSIKKEEAAPTSIYRVGVGDVLDIRLLRAPTNRSTLFTVLEDGLIEYPLAGGSLKVGGMTPSEIEARIASELKRRDVHDNSPVVVSVRDYNSHNVIVTGLVLSPGARILHREAVPLYVLLAEAQPRSDAARAVVMRAGGQITVNLNDAVAVNELIHQGDVITVVSRPPEYYYIGGKVFTPGQKGFQAGITLVQAILAAGGVTHSGFKTVDVSREGADGRLATTKYSLKDIRAGKVPDPRLEPGDRIEVGP